MQQELNDFEMFDMDDEGDYSDSDSDYDEEESEDGQPEKGKNNKSSDENSEEEAENTEGSSDTNETENENDNVEPEEEPGFDRYKKSVESNRDQFSPECRTDDSYRQNENSLLDAKCKPYLYLDIPTVNAKNVFTPAKRVQELLSNYYFEAISEGRFQVDAEKVADGLLETVKDLLNARRQPT
jgi:hypothetical protein